MKKFVSAMLVASMSLSVASHAFAATTAEKSVAQLTIELQSSNKQIDDINKQIDNARSLRRTELMIGLPISLGATALGILYSFAGSMSDAPAEGAAAGRTGGIMALGGVAAGAGTVYLVHLDNKNVRQWKLALAEAKKRNSETLAALQAIAQ